MIFYTLTAIAIIAVLLATTLAVREEGIVSGIVTFIVSGVMAAFMWVLVCVIVLGSMASAFGTPKESNRYDIQLAALSTGNDLDGRFFLGSGYIDSDQVFSYVYEENGAYRLTSVSADQSYVYEQNDKAPYLEVIQYTCDPNPWVSPWCILTGTPDQYLFFVPEGSVLNNYVVTP